MSEVTTHVRDVYLTNNKISRNTGSDILQMLHDLDIVYIHSDVDSTYIRLEYDDSPVVGEINGFIPRRN